MVSVLFSEPKIPQSIDPSDANPYVASFSALQRAENSSIGWRSTRFLHQRRVSVLFSEPKIPQLLLLKTGAIPLEEVSVLFSEPKIPQY